MWAIYKREMRSYLLSPMAWILWFAFALLQGWAFNYLFNEYADRAMMQQDINITASVAGAELNFVRFLCLILIPSLTMRLFAEEKQMGTIELLYTYPLTDVQLILGKLFAALTIACGSLLTSLPQLLYLSAHAPVDWSLLGALYLGLVLMILVFMTFGEMISAFTNSQVVAFAITFVTLLLLWMSNVFQKLFQYITLQMEVSWFMKPFLWLSWALATAYKYLSFSEQGENFSRGIINSNDVVLLLSLSFFFVFITLKKLETRKWRG